MQEARNAAEATGRQPRSHWITSITHRHVVAFGLRRAVEGSKAAKASKTEQETKMADAPAAGGAPHKVLAHMERAAAAPQHLDPSRDPADFVATNKAMRCCFVCRLVKSERQVCSSAAAIVANPRFWRRPPGSLVPLQFLESGCENCHWLRMEDDRGKVQDYTTPNFSGYVCFCLCFVSFWCQGAGYSLLEMVLNAWGHAWSRAVCVPLSSMLHVSSHPCAFSFSQPGHSDGPNH